MTNTAKKVNEMEEKVRTVKRNSLLQGKSAQGSREPMKK